MAAYNWLTFESVCPACGAATTLRAQFRTASAYSGDATGRFHYRTYAPGDTISWWPPNDGRHVQWSVDGDRTGTMVECCCAECMGSRAALYAVIEFERLRVRAVVEVGREADWPRGFLR